MRGTSAKSLSAQAKGTYRKYSHYFPRCLYDGVPQVSSDRADEVEGGVSDVLSNFAEHDESENSPPDFLIFEDVEAAYKEKQSCDWEEFVRNRDTVVIADAYLRILQQALEALVFLADTGFIHHDLKEDNMALRIYYQDKDKRSKPVVRVIDFGGMIKAKPKYLCVNTATNPSMPPEYSRRLTNKDGVVCNMMFDPDHPFAYDLYMMGGYLMHLLTGDAWVMTTLYGLMGAYNNGILIASLHDTFAKKFDEHAKGYAESEGIEHAVNMRLIWTEAACTALDEDGDITGDMQTMPVSQLMWIVSMMAKFGKTEQAKEDPDVEFKEVIYDKKHNKILDEKPNKDVSWIKTWEEPKMPDVYTKVWQGFEQENIQIEGHEFVFRVELLEVIAKMLTYEPGQRGTAKDLLVQTNHLRQELLRGLRK
mmetsp:Transcript_43339/g.123573  ORF Transcript_43339/g.123573 Transcript_43339/m.123573 type:complete len:421 (+) Transcript_43339:488-1750(+)